MECDTFNVDPDLTKAQKRQMREFERGQRAYQEHQARIPDRITALREAVPHTEGNSALVDYVAAEKWGYTGPGLRSALLRAHRWLLANPGNRKPPRHIAEKLSVLRPANVKG